MKTSTDNVLFTKEASYEYYAHGPLAKTRLGELNVETATFAYTVQGWVKQMQAEAFSFALGYNEKDYTSIGTSTILATPVAVVSGKSKGLYNGNIASMTSKTPKMAEIPNQQAILQQQYSYDQLNRITGSNTPGAGNAYKTGYSYDANGNIKTLARYDASSTKFDTLVYNYETKTNGYLRTTNRLRWVDDDALLNGLQQTDVDDQNTDNYNYDAIGNLIRDNQEEIDTIQWTVSGKVRKVIRTATSSKPNVEFEYDASGQRTVKKVIKKNGEITSTYYLRDATGNVMSVYSYNTGSDNDPALTEQYLYGSSRIGVYTPAANVLSKTRNFGRKSYEITDHLGNVRATLSDYRRQGVQAVVNSATDYYPFGMVARSYSSSQMYDYGFNGKMKDDEIVGGDYDYGYRIYDPRIARFLSIDPLTKFYPWYTPYQFAGNNPIKFIDIDGLEQGTFKIDDQEKRLATLTWEKIYVVVQAGEGAVDQVYLDYLKSDKFKEGVSDDFNKGKGTTIYIRNPVFNKDGVLTSFNVSNQKQYEKEGQTDVWKIDVKWDIVVNTENNALNLEQAKAFLEENKNLNGYIQQDKVTKADASGNTEIAHATDGVFRDVITLNPIPMKNLTEDNQFKYGKLIGHEVGHNAELTHGLIYPEDGLMSNDPIDHSENMRITVEENMKVLDKNKGAVKKQ